MAGDRFRRRSLLAGALGAVVLGCSSERAKRDTHRVDPLDRLPARGLLPTSLRIGISPSSGQDTDELLDPLVDYLERNLDGITVSAATADHYDRLQPMVDDRTVDIGIFSPLTYVKARRANLAAEAVATVTRAGSPTYLGYLVVRDEDPATTIHQLRGKSVAWVDKSSTSGYLYPRALLEDKGIADVDAFFGAQQFAGNHKDAVLALHEGRADVAAVAAPFVDPGPRNPLVAELGSAKAALDRLRVIAKTRRIPLDCVVVRNDLERSLAKRLRDALLAFDKDDQASLALQKTWNMNGFVRPDGRYDEIEGILARV